MDNTVITLKCKVLILLVYALFLQIVLICQIFSARSMLARVHRNILVVTEAWAKVGVGAGVLLGSLFSWLMRNFLDQDESWFSICFTQIRFISCWYDKWCFLVPDGLPIHPLKTYVLVNGSIDIILVELLELSLLYPWSPFSAKASKQLPIT